MNDEWRARVAVLDDDAAQCDGIAALLERAGFRAVVFSSPRKFLHALHHDSFDVLLLDWVMPEICGMEVLEHIREARREIPVIMLTCRSEDEHVVSGLRAGADDYLAKPVREEVLTARIEAILRRLRPPTLPMDERLSLGPYTLQRAGCLVTFGDQIVTLTNREFELAALFFANPNRPLARQYVLECLWGKGADHLTRTLDTHVARLRTKLKLGPSTGVRLNTLYGFGYRLEMLDVVA